MINGEIIVLGKKAAAINEGNGGKNLVLAGLFQQY